MVNDNKEMVTSLHDDNRPKRPCSWYVPIRTEATGRHLPRLLNSDCRRELSQ
jgi:hypothetical protein